MAQGGGNPNCSHDSHHVNKVEDRDDGQWVLYQCTDLDCEFEWWEKLE